MRPLQPRFYSIASSLHAQAGEVQLAVSVVRYSCRGHRRMGVCSAFLADRGEQEDVAIFPQSSHHFHPPSDPTRAMIMVGPGTGIAPFRGFLHDRQATGASEGPTGCSSASNTRRQTFTIATRSTPGGAAGTWTA